MHLHPRMYSNSQQLMHLLPGLTLTGHGSIRSILDDMKLLSTEAEGVNDAIPDAFKTDHVNAAGRVGALLGLKPQGTGEAAPSRHLVWAGVCSHCTSPA